MIRRVSPLGKYCNLLASRLAQWANGGRMRSASSRPGLGNPALGDRDRPSVIFGGSLDGRPDKMYFRHEGII